MLTVLYPPTIDWHFLFQRPQQLLLSFAKQGIQSIFCNKDHYLPQSPGIKELFPNFFLVNRSNPYAITMPGPPVLWITYPPHVHQLKNYRYQAVVFDALDEPSEEFSHWRRDAGTIVDQSDLVIASSMKLKNFYEQFGKPVHLVPNGVDFYHFSAIPPERRIEPFDLKKIPRPRICFSGALANWIDWKLVESVSKLCPDFSFVFIGPSLGDISIPHEPNLYYLGLKSYRQLPLYFFFTDVLIIPFRVSSMTKACNPIKFWEYLASGKPVVSTGLPEVAQYNVAAIADNPGDFAEAVKQALNSASEVNARNTRMNLAEANSWERRARTVIELIRDTVKQS